MAPLTHLHPSLLPAAQPTPDITAYRYVLGDGSVSAVSLQERTVAAFYFLLALDE